MLPPGKIEQPSSWSLDIKIVPVLIKDQFIMPHDFMSTDLAAMDKISVAIFYDQKTLAVARLGQDKAFTFQMVDDQDNHNHEIAFEMSGKIDAHTIGLGPSAITLCAQVEIWIETWRAIQFITDDTPLILGQNHKRKGMQLETPIYRWLLSNTGKIFGHYDLRI
jgi:hypothetical protein